MDENNFQKEDMYSGRIAPLRPNTRDRNSHATGTIQSASSKQSRSELSHDPIDKNERISSSHHNHERKLDSFMKRRQHHAAMTAMNADALASKARTWDEFSNAPEIKGIRCWISDVSEKS